MAGCSPVTQLIKTDNTIRESKSVNEVRVFLDKPTNKYLVIGMIQVGPDVLVDGYAEQTKYLIEEAAKLACSTKNLELRV
jgi:hypothetical protein